MFKKIGLAFVFSAVASVALAAPFDEVTVGLPVPSLDAAVTWYATLLGPGVEMIQPAPGIAEFKIAPSVWLQLFEVDVLQPSNGIIRFSVEDFEATQKALAAADINIGDAIAIPDVVTFSEFTDPFGNALGFYSIP